MTDVYFHEDDYCQIELLPAWLRDYCCTEAGRIDEFAAAHRDGGIGYTGIYVRPSPPATYRNLEIALSGFSAAASQWLPSLGRVFTGYASHRELARNTHAWGLQGARLFAETDAAGTVAAAWLVLSGPEPHAVSTVQQALLALPRRDDTLLVDWTWSKVLLLREPAALHEYLDLHRRRDVEPGRADGHGG